MWNKTLVAFVGNSIASLILVWGMVDHFAKFYDNGNVGDLVISAFFGFAAFFWVSHARDRWLEL